MNLFPYVSAIALSWGRGVVDLSQHLFLNFMQPGVQPSVEMIPCQIALHFSDLVFHRSW